MKDLNLMSIIDGYRAVIETVPDETCYDYPEDTTDFDYDLVLDVVWDGMHQLMDALLKTETFAIVLDRDGEIVRIFDTANDRDCFVNKMNQSEAQRKVSEPETVNPNATLSERLDSGEVVCRAITFAEFKEYAQSEEYVLNCYCYDPDDGVIDFDRRGYCFLEDDEFEEDYED